MFSYGVVVAGVFCCWIKQREMDTLLATILDHGHDLVGAEKCSLFFVDEERKELWSKVTTDQHGAIKVRELFCCSWWNRESVKSTSFPWGGNTV